MKIAVTGALGQLGRELCRQLGDRALPLARADLDLANLDSIAERLFRLRPTAVINAAAYTQVDRAEREPVLCHRINAAAVVRLAAACDHLGCPLVQISSDYVFGEERERAVPYLEADAVGPLNVYGCSKLAGETAAAQCHRHLIVRTCGLYARPRSGREPANFVSTMLRLASEARRVRVVNDQRCTPSYAPHVAAAIVTLVEEGATGIWHIVNGGDVSWWAFARQIVRRATLSCEIEPISSLEYGALARRPCYSVLSATKLQSSFGLALASWEEALDEYLLMRTQSGVG